MTIAQRDAGAVETFVDLVRDQQGIIRRIARLYAGTPAEQEDLAQEICLQLWRSYPSYAGRAKLSTWVYSVALNTAVSMLRRRTRHPQADELPDLPAPSRANDDDEDRLELLYAALRRLGEVDRAVILLWLEDKSYDEIGEIVGLSRTNVSVRLVRAKERLRAIVSDLEATAGR